MINMIDTVLEATYNAIMIAVTVGFCVVGSVVSVSVIYCGILSMF